MIIPTGNAIKMRKFLLLYVSSRSNSIVIDMTFNVQLNLSQNMICDIEI